VRGNLGRGRRQQDDVVAWPSDERVWSLQEVVRSYALVCSVVPFHLCFLGTVVRSLRGGAWFARMLAQVSASVSDSDAKRQSKHEDHESVGGTRAALPLARIYGSERELTYFEDIVRQNHMVGSTMFDTWV
jgi:hypothetical protein